MDIKKIIRQFLLEQEGEEIAPQQPQLTRQQKEIQNGRCCTNASHQSS